MLHVLSEQHKGIRHFLPTVAYLAAAVMFFVPPVQAQGGGVDPTGTGGQHSIRGRIYFPSGRRSDLRVIVRLHSYNSGELSVLSDANGSFGFTGLIPGSYTVIVDGGDDYETVRETVYIETEGNTSRTGNRMPLVPRTYTVQISLQPKHAAATRPGVLSASLATVPEQARKLYESALENEKKGDNKKAMEELKAALSIYPDFPLALNELGVEYLRSGQADKAADVFRRAVRMSPQGFQPTLNYGVALLNMRRFAEAEEQFRGALRLNNSALTGHMYLGIVLAIQRKLEEAEKELKIATDSQSPEVALAHRYLGGVFLEKHQYQLAAAELETYLRLVPKAADADWLRQKIKELHNKG